MRANILVEGNKIVYIGKEEPEHDSEINAGGKFIIPCIPASGVTVSGWGFLINFSAFLTGSPFCVVYSWSSVAHARKPLIPSDSSVIEGRVTDDKNLSILVGTLTEKINQEL